MPFVKLEILFDPTNGNVSVNGPIQDRLLCYGLLGTARDLISAQALQRTVPAEENRIQPVTGLEAIHLVQR